MQAKSDLWAMALAYAEDGTPVFPCEENGKRPITLNGFKDATTDLEQINKWWSENPNYNLALSPEDAGLFVIDIDPGADPEIYLQLPKTYTVKTPRGGYHYYYEGSGPSSVSKLAKSVDTRGEGGYILVEPSVTSDGVYKLDTAIDYAPAPAWAMEKLAAIDTPVAAAVQEKDLQPNIDRAKKQLKKYVDAGDVSIEGVGGDDRLYRLCCEMLDLGLSPEKAHDLISDIWNDHCEPPWDGQEIFLKLENAQNFMQNEGGAYAVEPAEEVFGDTVKKLFKEEPQKQSRFHWKDESEQDQEADPTWIIKDLISERSTVMLYGVSGSYKSFMALDIALSIAMGKESFGSPVKQGLVFYGALEGRAHLRKARRAWRTLKGVEGAIDNFFLGFAPMVALPEEVQEFGDEITKRCAGRKPTLIIIDTLSKAMAGLNENDAKDASMFIKFCDSLVEHFGCAVVAIHHAGKNAERGARGSSAFFAGFDTVLEVKAHKETKAVAVHVHKHKDAEERERPWTFEGKVVGPSLAFEATDWEAHRLLVGGDNSVKPVNVGKALQELNAFGEDAGVTTAVLATQLTPSRESQSIEDRSVAISRTGKVLLSGAKSFLEGYCIKKGKEYVWHLPAAKT